jgi:hypothetical protein
LPVKKLCQAGADALEEASAALPLAIIAATLFCIFAKVLFPAFTQPSHFQPSYPEAASAA